MQLKSSLCFPDNLGEDMCERRTFDLSRIFLQESREDTFSEHPKWQRLDER